MAWVEYKRQSPLRTKRQILECRVDMVADDCVVATAVSRRGDSFTVEVPLDYFDETPELGTFFRYSSMARVTLMNLVRSSAEVKRRIHELSWLDSAFDDWNNTKDTPDANPD